MMILPHTEQSRKCPLCSGQVGDYLIHNIRSKYDYQKHYLPPLRAASPSAAPLARAQAAQRRRARREVEWGRSVRRERERERRAADELERAIEKRRWVYRHHLYAKVGPARAAVPAASDGRCSTSRRTRTRATARSRRPSNLPPIQTLSVALPFSYAGSCGYGTLWTSRCVSCRILGRWLLIAGMQFLTTFTISLMKSLDIRSEPAVKLLAEFLDMDSDGLKTNAEHFAHGKRRHFTSVEHATHT